MDLICSDCGDPCEQRGCERCGGLAEFDLGALRLDPAAFREALAQRRMAQTGPWSSGVWRFAELLPPIPGESVTTLRENNVPLYEAPRGGDYAGVEDLRYLHLGFNPTGSFKDAGMTVAVSAAKAAGAHTVLCASTGNTAASMGAYAARAGLQALVLVPREGVSPAKVAQTLDYGARVVAIDGDFDAALVQMRERPDDGAALVNSVNPYRIEGQKCAAFVLLETLDWNPPDWLVLPGGNLGNASAFGKGFREALALGLIAKLPRIAVAQAAGAAPFVRAFQTGEPLVPVQAKTDATAIKIGAPASWRKALRVLRETNGTAASATDAQIADARAIVGRDGVGCEPASAASLAVAKLLRENGTIAKHEQVVCVLTGNVLKDTAYAQRYHESNAQFANPVRMQADVANV
jgi:threonine synthase